MGWFKNLRRAVENVVKSPGKIIKRVVEGDIKSAAGIVVNPFAGQEETRQRTLRRAGGVVAGAVGGFVTGGPVGAVIGGTVGGLRAKQGQGQLKDYAESIGIGLASGYAISNIGTIVKAGSTVLTKAGSLVKALPTVSGGAIKALPIVAGVGQTALALSTAPQEPGLIEIGTPPFFPVETATPPFMWGGGKEGAPIWRQRGMEGPRGTTEGRLYPYNPKAAKEGIDWQVPVIILVAVMIMRNKT